MLLQVLQQAQHRQAHLVTHSPRVFHLVQVNLLVLVLLGVLSDRVDLGDLVGTRGIQVVA